MSKNTLIIQVFDSWGEFGASSLASQVAFSLSKKGKVLLIDLHEKANATTSLGKNPIDLGSRNFTCLFKKRYHGDKKENSLRALHVKVFYNLYLISGFPHIPIHYSKSKIKKALYNLAQAKNNYDYIVIDGPSSVNHFVQKLFQVSCVNLIPFSLTYISHSHIQKILKSILSKRAKQVRLFFIPKSLEIKKQKAILLYKLFKQVLERIPKLKRPDFYFVKSKLEESSNSIYDQHKTTVMSLGESHPVRRSVELITKEILFKMEEKPSVVKKISRRYIPLSFYFPYIYRTLGVMCLFLIIQFVGEPLVKLSQPKAITLSFFEKENRPKLEHYFENKESLYKVVKWAISHQTAIVPTVVQLNSYIQEVIFLHNQSNPYSKRIIGNVVPSKTTVKFPPPSNIFNSDYHKTYPAYTYFLKTVDDKKAYITGEWAERGLGGRQKHQGIDIAAPLGTVVRTPIDGIAYISYSLFGGKVVSIRSGKNILYFGHLGKRFVKSGQLVHKGDPIGVIGLTGRTSGPHVHIGFGIEFPDGTRIAGKHYKFTDPLFFFYRKIFLSNLLTQ